MLDAGAGPSFDTGAGVAVTATEAVPIGDCEVAGGAFAGFSEAGFASIVGLGDVVDKAVPAGKGARGVGFGLVVVSTGAAGVGRGGIEPLCGPYCSTGRARAEEVC